MTNHKDDCVSIFERIHKDFHGLKTSEYLRDGDVSSTRMSRRTHAKGGDGGGKTPSRPRLPPNVGNRIPHPIYEQIKKWFDEAARPKEERNQGFFNSFVWKHHTPKPKVKVVTKFREPPAKKEPKKQPRCEKRQVSFGSKKDAERTTRRRRRQSSSDENMSTRSQSRSRSDSRDRSHKSSSAGRSSRRSRRKSRKEEPKRARRQSSSEIEQGSSYWVLR